MKKNKKYSLDQNYKNALFFVFHVPPNLFCDQLGKVSKFWVKGTEKNAARKEKEIDDCGFAGKVELCVQ